nr:immunoglobulin heavy chain junction region [Mus musculus]
CARVVGWGFDYW